MIYVVIGKSYKKAVSIQSLNITKP